jgi:serine/threonine-protein kinase
MAEGQQQVNICPNCEKEGQLGEPCPAEICTRKDYRFVPKEWVEASRRLAEKKHKPFDPLIGRRIGRYLLAGKIGEGGMGAVYLALQEPLFREVALKVISGLEMTDAAIKRFEREARAIAALEHPNIVKLYDYGIGKLEYTIPYMALEYVRHGRTIRHALTQVRKEKGLIPKEVVLNIFRQILNALYSAHSLGIVHRDMKPDNCLTVAVEGNPHFVKILDFGLAKAVSEMSGFGGDVSHTGDILGTPYYMAPEQASRGGSRKVDARADLFGVAVMLYEVFTGVRPYDADSALSILMKKIDKTFDPLALREASHLPEPLKMFLRKGLQSDPDKRFADARSMLLELESALSDKEVSAVGPSALQADGSSKGRASTPDSVGVGMAKEEEDEDGRSETIVASAKGKRSHKKPLALSLIVVMGVAVAVGGYFGGVFGEKSPEAQSVSMDVRDAFVHDASVQWAKDIGSTSRIASAKATMKDASVSDVFMPQKGGFVVETSPQGGLVTIDGKQVGNAPVRHWFEVKSSSDKDIKVRIGVSMKGYESNSVVMTLGEALAKERIVVELKPLETKKPSPKPQKPYKPEEKQKGSTEPELL